MFSNTIEQHYTDLIQIFNILQKAHFHTYFHIQDIK